MINKRHIPTSTSSVVLLAALIGTSQYGAQTVNYSEGELTRDYQNSVASLNYIVNTKISNQYIEDHYKPFVKSFNNEYNFFSLVQNLQINQINLEDDFQNILNNTSKLVSKNTSTRQRF